MGNIIEARELCFTYDADETGAKPRPAVNGVSFDVGEGEFLCILGHNGSGKSTLAKLMCMLLEPDSGELTVCGRRVTGEGVTDADIYAARRDVGMVFQNPDNQIVATVVEEDVAFALENIGVEPSEIRKRVDEALKTVGMYHYREHAPHKLSGGQKQRIAIAGVLAMQPACIVMDEPTAMLDPIGRREIMQTIKRLNEAGVTIILITHYMEEAAQAKRVVVMDSGKIIADDRPKKVFAQAEKLKEVGLDVPDVTDLTHLLIAEGIKLPDDIISEDECVERLYNLLKKG